jgi:hypothetical protein
VCAALIAIVMERHGIDVMDVIDVMDAMDVVESRDGVSCYSVS